MGRHYFLDLLYVWLPVLFALLGIVGSALVSLRHPSLIQIGLTLGVFGCAVWSMITLYRIFGLEEHQVQVIVFMGREHLNRIPHIVILVAFCIFAGQAFWYFGQRQKAA